MLKEIEEKAKAFCVGDMEFSGNDLKECVKDIGICTNNDVSKTDGCIAKQLDSYRNSENFFKQAAYWVKIGKNCNEVRNYDFYKTFCLAQNSIGKWDKDGGNEAYKNYMGCMLTATSIYERVSSKDKEIKQAFLDICKSGVKVLQAVRKENNPEFINNVTVLSGLMPKGQDSAIVNEINKNALEYIEGKLCYLLVQVIKNGKLDAEETEFFSELEARLSEVAKRVEISKGEPKEDFGKRCNKCTGLVEEVKKSLISVPEADKLSILLGLIVKGETFAVIAGEALNRIEPKLEGLLLAQALKEHQFSAEEIELFSQLEKAINNISETEVRGSDKELNALHEKYNKCVHLIDVVNKFLPEGDRKETGRYGKLRNIFKNIKANNDYADDYEALMSRMDEYSKDLDEFEKGYSSEAIQKDKQLSIAINEERALIAEIKNTAKKRADIKTAMDALNNVETELDSLLKEIIEKDDIVPQAETILKHVNEEIEAAKSARGSKEEIEPLQKKLDKCMEHLELVNKSLKSREVHDRVALATLRFDYLSIFNKYDLAGFTFGADIPLWHRLIITPQFKVSFTTSRKITKGYPKLYTDPATGESKIERKKTGHSALAVAGGLGLGALAYRGANVSLLIGLNGLIGHLESQGVDSYPYQETFGYVLGGLELRLCSSSMLPFGIALSAESGAYCSITNGECYGMLLSGFKILSLTDEIIH